MKKICRGFVSQCIQDGNLIYIIAGYRLTIYDTQANQIVSKIKTPTNSFYVAITRGKSIIAIKNTSGKLFILDKQSGDLLKSYFPTQVEGVEIFLTQDGQSIVSGDWEGNFYLTNWETEKTEILFKAPHMLNKIEYNSFQDEYLIYCRRYRVLRWAYPFTDKAPEVLELEPRKRKLRLDFIENEPSYCGKMGKFVMADMSERRRTTMKVCILDKYLMQVVGMKEIEVKEFNRGIPCYWSENGEYFAVTNNMVERGFTVYIFRTKDMEIVQELAMDYVMNLKFIDERRIFIGSAEGGYIGEF